MHSYDSGELTRTTNLLGGCQEGGSKPDSIGVLHPRVSHAKYTSYLCLAYCYDRQLTSVEASSLNRPQAVFLLLTLVSGYYLYPFRAEAKTEPLVFDRTINTIPYGPYKPSEPPKPTPQVKKPSAKATQSPQFSRRYNPTTRFAAGNCTDYVARRVTVSWGGNANQWIRNASADGFIVDRNPQAGAILVTSESRYGHVAYIEKVEGTQVYISEWNYVGPFKLSHRILDISNPIIKGIIHP